MRLYLLSILVFQFTFITNISFAAKNSDEVIDSLLRDLSKEQDRLKKLSIYVDLLYIHTDFKPEEGLKYEDPALRLAEGLESKLAIAKVKLGAGRIYWRLGKFENALKRHFDALDIYVELREASKTGNVLTYIGQDYADSGNYPEARKYFHKALEVYTKLNDKSEMANIYSLFAWVCANEGNYTESTRNNLAALNLFEEIGDRYSAAICMGNMGDDYAGVSKYTEALDYYFKALKPLEEFKDHMNVAGRYVSIGNIYLKLKNYSEAIKYQEMGLKRGMEIKNYFIAGNAYAGLGDVYNAQGEFTKALENYLLSVEMYESVFNKQELSAVYNDIGIIYVRLKKYDLAGKYFNEVNRLSKELDSKVVLANYYSGIELLDSARGNWKGAYFNYKNFVVSRDSIFNQANTNKIVQAQMQYESDKKEAIEKAEQEKKDIRQRTIRNSITAVLGGSLVFLVVVYRQRNKISKEKKRSEELLLNILPEETAEELKSTGTTKARDYDEVTVLFTDFKNFTTMSEKLSAQELVNEINYCYSAFDKIITKYGIEKIKTIGDSYMCAGGLPVPNSTHATDTVSAALEIRDFVEQEKMNRMKDGLPFFEIRIGLNSGPVVAGIVGIKKFAYDIWGDTVNIASRMESSGEIGKVNISGSTYQLVKDKFKCVHRGKIQAKNKGEIDMYFITSGN